MGESARVRTEVVGIDTEVMAIVERVCQRSSALSPLSVVEGSFF